MCLRENINKKIYIFGWVGVWKFCPNSSSGRITTLKKSPHPFKLFNLQSVCEGGYGEGSQGGGDGHLALLTANSPHLCCLACTLPEEGPAKGDFSSHFLPPPSFAGDPTAAKLAKVSTHSQASWTPGNKYPQFMSKEFCSVQT